MKPLYFAMSLALFVGGCSLNDLKLDVGLAPTATEGQLFCAIATDGGPIVAAIVSATVPGAVLAMGATAAFVVEACKEVGGTPVSPPANPAAAPVKAIVPPVA